jgi:hypothetical protein
MMINCKETVFFFFFFLRNFAKTLGKESDAVKPTIIVCYWIFIF